MAFPQIFNSFFPALHRKDQTIISRAVTIIVLLCVSMVAFAIWNSWSSYQVELRKTENSLSNRTFAISQHATSTIKSADTILFDLVERLEVDGTGEAALKRLHPLLKRGVLELPQLHGLFIYDEAGKWLVNSQPALMKNVNNSDREYFKYHRDNPDLGPYIGSPVRSRSTGDWIITVTRRFNHPDGTFAGVVLATLSMEYFKDYFNIFTIGNKGLILLWLSDGTVIAKRPFDAGVLGNKAENDLFMANPLLDREGVATIRSTASGEDMIYSYKRLDDYPLIIASAVSKDEVLERWKSETCGIFIGIALLLTTIGILGLRLIRQLNKGAQAEEQRRTADARIHELAFYDHLTHLPNRSLLLERLQHALLNSARTGQYCALLFIDLDNFKSLNDSFGHDKGDMLLQQVALRLLACVRESDTVARLGGDEFVVMLENLSNEQTEAGTCAKSISRKILSSFAQPFTLSGYEHFTSPSIGVTLFSGKELTAEELLKRADMAMYEAKAAGRNTIRFFDPQMQAIVNHRALIEAELRQAFIRNQLSLYFQPQMDAEGNIIGAEALVRWQHEKRGLIPPLEFISVAENSGLIIQLGIWVLRTACCQLAQWAAEAQTSTLSIAVNVSARQFRHPDFVEQTLAILKETGANPMQLKLELTESVLVEDMESTISRMKALQQAGIGFSLDDFGTGYSSLAYLRQMPLDQLKIDQSFVRDMLNESNGASIVRMILALGRAIGVTVIAEGVETREQFDFLLKEGCEAFQGYYFSRPLSIENLQSLVCDQAVSADVLLLA